MQTRWYRLTSAAVAAAGLLAAPQVDAVADTAGESTLLLLSEYLLLLLVIVGCLLCIAPRSLWTSVDHWRCRGVNLLRRSDLPASERASWSLTICGVAAFLVLTGWNLGHPDDVADDDQLAFLQTAREVHASGGPPALLRDLYAGRFLEANRHPLYIALLSISPTESFGRRLSFAIGLATLSLLTWLVRQHSGSLVAGVFCLLLGTNGAFCQFSTRVVCDVLMVLWGGLAYLLASQQSGGNRWRSLLLGIVLGLAYLTKGTGLLLFVGYIVWVGGLTVYMIWRSRTAGPRTTVGIASKMTTCTLVLLTWLIVVSPLVVRNVQIHRSPFYNVNSYLLFTDTYEDPQKLAEKSSLEVAASDYLQTHTLGELAQRELTGLVWETFIMLRMLGPATLDDARVLFGVPLALCAFVAVVADPRREHLLLGCWVAVCVPLFAWYVPVAAGERFPLPLLAPILMLSATGILRLAAGVLTARNGDLISAAPLGMSRQPSVPPEPTPDRGA